MGFVSKNSSYLQQVRMAERSKAPDSRISLLTDSERAFWSSYEGVGSNPTSDKYFFPLFCDLFSFNVNCFFFVLKELHFYVKLESKNIYAVIFFCQIRGF